MAELCISVVGLEFAFKVAAPGTKSVVTAAFWFTVFAGDFFGGFFNKALWGTVTPGVFFALQTAIVAVATLLFYVVSRRFEQPAAPGEATPMPASSPAEPSASASTSA